MKKIHYAFMPTVPHCGAYANKADITTDRDKVTCGSCMKYLAGQGIYTSREQKP